MLQVKMKQRHGWRVPSSQSRLCPKLLSLLVEQPEVTIWTWKILYRSIYFVEAIQKMSATEQVTPTAVPDSQPAEKVPEPTAENTAAAVPEEKPSEAPAEKPAEANTNEPATADAAAAPVKEESKEAPKEEPAVTKENDAAEAKPAEAAPAKPEFLAKNPALSQFFDKLPSILSKTGHSEMWGVTLKDASHPPTANILIKFLRANEGNVALAEQQLTKALEWRKKINPTALVETSFNASKYGGLGYITSHKDPKNGEVIFTWNIYGAVKDINATFGDVDDFIKWRVALMEIAVKDLKLGEATSVIDYTGEDPYQMIQVHDYQNVSFLRLNPTIRAASKQTIEVFSMAYPELLREKFFVNVPAIMGWMFTAMKVFLSKNTLRKFHPITNGANLAREFSFADEIPKSYGGKAPELKESGATPRLSDEQPAPAATKDEPAKEEPPKDAAKEEPSNEPVKEEKPKEEPVEERTNKEEAKEEPAKEEPAKEEPTKAEPPKEEPAKEEPAKEEPAKEEPAKEEPAKAEPVKEQQAEEAKEEPAKAESAAGAAALAPAGAE
ncbi:hypothetical protein DTO164E3_3408 [Paecilomyces variotii]|nr:hypothetical protein DTO032I3_6304 [Paecilomyces variotii]KAJ9201970.1 hypothetical protein DTO164E3_3408 [Paecilomyces variotii]KAJ9225136.1 hypothetical protein DTO169C6_2477 [Paecilomyces variotii]KAJ9263647.1 hypothetical protein DTO195F2_2907 [Paecilomyces variotii]KAJ9276008.1 hypothetical protein DTO021D3_7189 [Paecilomyces variotii]